MKFLIITTNNRKIFGIGNITFADTKIFFDDILGKENEVPFADIKEIREDNEVFVPYPEEEANRIFDHWLEISEFWYTSDMKAFIRVEEAIEHSLTLSNTIVSNYSILEGEAIQY